jgi:protein SCO1/2
VIARRWVLTAAAAAALGLATFLVLDAPEVPPPEIGGYVLARPRALPALDLVDEHGEPFPSARFAGHWSLLFFGYTYCPDICPLTLVELAAMKRELAASASSLRADYYLVSVDPRRDTPERLREYVAYFDPDFRGLTGSPDALAALAHATETVFAIPDGQDADNYLVSHSSNVIVLDPRGAVHAIFTPPHDPARLAADFTKVVAHAATTR